MEARTRDHFPKPRIEDRRAGKRTSTCLACGAPLVRRGRFMASDGVRGLWRHRDRLAKGQEQ